VVGVERATGFDSISPITASSPLLTSSPSPTPSKLLDTYVRVSAISATGVELGKHKSETIKSCNDPAYNDTSVFEIQRADLEQSSIMIQVYTYSGMFNRKKLQLGWICVGGSEAGKASSADAQQHWQV